MYKSNCYADSIICHEMVFYSQGSGGARADNQSSPGEARQLITLTSTARVNIQPTHLYSMTVFQHPASTPTPHSKLISSHSLDGVLWVQALYRARSPPDRTPHVLTNCSIINVIATS